MLFYSKKYHLCIKDIEESLNQGYPDHLKYKLFERKAKSLHYFGYGVEAIKVYEQALEFLDMSNLDTKAKIKRENCLKDKLTDAHKNKCPRSRFKTTTIC